MKPLKDMIEFTDDAGTWALDATASVDENGVEHVIVTVEERREGRKRPITTRVDLDVSNAREVGALLMNIADALEERLATAVL